jgi:hypothetical protein
MDMFLSRKELENASVKYFFNSFIKAILTLFGCSCQEFEATLLSDILRGSEESRPRFERKISIDNCLQTDYLKHNIIPVI